MSQPSIVVLAKKKDSGRSLSIWDVEWQAADSKRKVFAQQVDRVPGTLQPNTLIYPLLSNNPGCDSVPARARYDDLLCSKLAPYVWP